MSNAPPRIMFAVALLALIAGSVAMWTAYGPGPWRWRDMVAVVWFPLGMAYVWVVSEIGARKRANSAAHTAGGTGSVTKRWVAM